MRKSVAILICLIFSMFLSGCSPLPVVVVGKAMNPNFNEGDKLLMNKNIGELKRGDVVNFLYPKDKSKQYIKRIVGLPNKKIEIRNGTVFINDSEIDEPYVDQNFNQSKQNIRPQTIPENQYFVLGDNRDNSSDSRSWGTLPKELIVGKLYLTYSKAK